MIENIPENVIERILKIRMIVLDVDGVLTDGSIILGSDDMEMKVFNIQDGMGITLAKQGGLKTGIITGRKSDAVAKRSAELKFDVVYQGAGDKMVAYTRLLDDHDIQPDEICYMGDDLLDLCLMRRVGLAVSPVNGRDEVKAAAHLITESAGGQGAVRELVEIVLKIQGQWNSLIEKFN